MTPHGGRAGWAAVCRLISATHLAGERGSPVLDLAELPDGVAELLASGDLMVLLGPSSAVGVAATRRRDDLALAALAPWRELVPRSHLVVELVSHRLPGGAAGRREGWGPGTSPHAARMAGVARQAGLTTVLTNAVRYADRRDAVTVDVLDASRRLVALDQRHVDRANAEGFLKSGKQMHEIAEEICRVGGLGERDATQLLADTRKIAERCALDPRADLGLGEVHFPEFTLSTDHATADIALRARCEGAVGDRYGSAPRQVIWKRLDDELEMIRGLGYASYFLTVADVTDLIKGMGVRCAARGSGAGSLVNYLLGVSGVDPIRHGLLMERFLSPLREALPDIDIDVESARRLEVYEAILDTYGGERCVCVSMMDTYRVRHAVRDVGAALGMPPGEIDAIAKAFPHIRARDARIALRELPELRAGGLGEADLDLMFQLVERLDGLPRHIAVHPCGVLLSDATLLDRTPVEASFAGFPMSQFDKDDVEDLGLLKLDVLGIRMQSSMAHAVAEIKRVDDVEIDLDDEEQVPFDDEPTYRMISSAKTLGVFQIESPGQRELVGKSGIETFGQIITDISLFRPGPVKSDMITPYLEVKQGWRQATLPPPRPAPDPRGDLRRRGLPRADHRDHRQVRPHRLRRGRREAPGPRRRGGHGRHQAVVLPPGARTRLPAPGRGADLEGDRGVRLVRLLQGPRRGVRAADLPVRLAQDPLAGALPGRGAHPRPRHVSQAADPRGRPPPRHHDPRPRRQHLREGVRRGASHRRRDGVRHPARPGRGQGDQRGRGRADRGRPALPVAHRLLAPRAGLPAGRGAAGAGRRLRQRLLDRPGDRRWRRHGPAGPGHPARPAAAGGRARPLRPLDREGRPGSRAGPHAARSGRGRPGRRRRAAQQHRPSLPRPGRRPRAAPARPAGGLGEGGGPEQGDRAATAGQLGAARPRPRRRPARG